MKVFLICNPISGGGRGAEMLAQLRAELAARKHECDFFQTNRAGDAEECAAKLSGNYAALGVIGGDGTLAEVVNGLADCSRYPLLSIPAGTANMLCKELRIPTAPSALVDIMERGKTISADLGEAEFSSPEVEPTRVGQGVAPSVGDGQQSSATLGQRDRIRKKFLLVASAGFDAEVARRVKLRRKGALGYLGYFVPLLSSLAGYNFPRMTVAVDGQPEEECALAIIGNTKNYGGIFSITSWADLASGKYEIGMLKNCGLIALFSLALRALCGKVKPDDAAGFAVRQGVEISLNAKLPDRLIPVELDGDWVGYTPLRVKMQPDKVCLLIS